MSLTLEEVEHIALLARLDLNAEEKQRYQQQLSDILDHIARLQKLDTEKISPPSSALPRGALLREDTPIKGLSTDRALENAPDAEENQFKVPPVCE